MVEAANRPIGRIAPTVTTYFPVTHVIATLYVNVTTMTPNAVTRRLFCFIIQLEFSKIPICIRR